MKMLRMLVLSFLCLTIVTGLFYPLSLVVLANRLFPWEATGSLLMRDGAIVGSRHIGQYFQDERYFWGRPSATTGYPYNSMASGGSNLAWSNPKLLERIRKTVDDLAQTVHAPYAIPIDWVTTSGSGLDPDVSLQAALYQVPRVAQKRSIAPEHLALLVYQCTQPRFLGLFGEPAVNVLQLNLALDEWEKNHGKQTQQS